MQFENNAKNSDSSSKLFGKIGRAINKKLIMGVDYRVILDELFDALDHLIPFDRIGIGLLANENRDVELKWAKSKLPGANLKEGYKAKLSGSSLEHVLISRQPRIINDLIEYLSQHTASESTKLAIRDGIRSSLTFPLVSDGVIIGFIFFSSATPQTYTASHIQTFDEVAEEIALLVNYGQLNKFFEVNQSHDQMMRTTIHELRSPLSVIQGYLDFMKDEAWYQSLESGEQDLFKILRRNADAMLTLVADLSDANQLAKSGPRINLEEISLRDFCRELIENGQILAAKKKIKFDAFIANDLPTTWKFDANRIRQVANNLLSNAVKFSWPGAVIRFEVSYHNEQLNFSVQDTGQGIPPHEMGKLFKDFGKTSVRPTSGESSSGLGLAICKRILEAHHGTITVESKVDFGSTFRFSLPNMEVIH